MDDAQNLEERILKLRKSACSSGPKAVKANFFTASETLRALPWEFSCFLYFFTSFHRPRLRTLPQRIRRLQSLRHHCLRFLGAQKTWQKRDSR